VQALGAHIDADTKVEAKTQKQRVNHLCWFLHFPYLVRRQRGGVRAGGAIQRGGHPRPPAAAVAGVATDAAGRAAARAPGQPVAAAAPASGRGCVCCPSSFPMSKEMHSATVGTRHAIYDDSLKLSLHSLPATLLSNKHWKVRTPSNP
jgi:hypothetical protein